MSAYVYTARHPRNSRRVTVQWKDQQGNPVGGFEVIDCLMMAFLYKPSAGGGFYAFEMKELDRERNWARRMVERHEKAWEGVERPRYAAIGSCYKVGSRDKTKAPAIRVGSSVIDWGDRPAKLYMVDEPDDSGAVRHGEVVSIKGTIVLPDETLVCPYCGKHKRGWRTQDDQTLCANCERTVRQ